MGRRSANTAYYADFGVRCMIPGSNSEPFVINAFYAGGTGDRPGQVMEFGHIDDEAFVVSKMFDRIRHAPRGMRR